MAQQLLDRLAQQFPGALLETHAQHGNETCVVAPARLREVAGALRDAPELGMDMPIDCTVVDLMGRHAQRFEAIWHLRSSASGRRLRLKVRVDEARPQVPSLTPLWPGFNWHEREAWDLYGIRFIDHPDLRRVLMYEEFVGHPLRKDYPIDGRQPLVELRKVRDVPTQRRAVPEMLNRP